MLLLLLLAMTTTLSRSVSINASILVDNYDNAGYIRYLVDLFGVNYYNKLLEEIIDNAECATDKSSEEARMITNLVSYTNIKSLSPRHQRIPCLAHLQ